MKRIALLNKKGLTLVEVMVALVIALIVFLALMQTALVGIDSNMINILRDEAVRTAEMKMSETRNRDFDSLTEGINSEQVFRDLRNIQNFPYTVTRTITDLNTDNKQIDITVTWEWKENTVASGNPYTHAINTILRRQ